jgi:putative transcriptional regulator
MKDRVQKGTFLIAEPFLNDSNFERSVILLCEHSANGSLGFVVNHETNLFLGDVVEEEIYEDIPLFVGGPVEKNTLHFLHRRPDLIPESQEVRNGIYWGGDFQQAKTKLNEFQLKPEEIRFFIGYSGWSEGQLEEEMNQKTWITTDSSASFLFGTSSKSFWREILKRMGGEYRSIAHYPIDPSLN